MSNLEIIEQLQKSMPAIFAATELDRLTGGAIKWVTLQNKRASKTIPQSAKPPQNCFKMDGLRKVLILRDPLIEWWLGTLTDCE